MAGRRSIHDGDGARFQHVCELDPLPPNIRLLPFQAQVRPPSERSSDAALSWRPTSRSTVDPGSIEFIRKGLSALRWTRESESGDGWRWTTGEARGLSGAGHVGPPHRPNPRTTGDIRGKRRGG